MKSSKKIIFEFLVSFLVVTFAFDALAIWDVVEQIWGDVHTQQSENEMLVETHFHDSEQTHQRQTQPVDSCTLCPCCVSGVNMFVSYFEINRRDSLLSMVILPESQAVSFSEYQIFHPPRHTC